MMNIFSFSFLMMSINSSSTFKVDYARPSVLVAIMLLNVSHVPIVWVKLLFLLGIPSVVFHGHRAIVFH